MVLLLLLIYGLMYFPFIVRVLCLYLFCYVLLCVHTSFAIILKRKRKLVALLLLSYRCIVTLNILWLFLTVPWVGLQCMIVVFPDHTHLLFNKVSARVQSQANTSPPAKRHSDCVSQASWWWHAVVCLLGLCTAMHNSCTNV